MAFYEYYVDFELKKQTGAYSFLLLGRWSFCPSSQHVRGMKLQWTNSWPFAEKSWTICQETLDHLPRMPTNPRPSAKKFQGPPAENANKSSAICRDCQQLPLKYACQECRVCLGCRLIRQPRQPINSETEFAKASQG